MILGYTRYFYPHERVRFLVRPGITGLAQVSGRNHASWDERFANDVRYVRDRSFLLDLRILLKTAVHVLAAQDVVVDPGSVMRNLDEERAHLACGREGPL